MRVVGALGGLVEGLKDRVGAVAAAFVSRDGVVLYASLPSGVPAETYAIMCATMYGAAAAANAELGRSPPERLVLEGGGVTTIVVGCGPDALLVAAVDPSPELTAIVDELTRTALRLVPA